MKRMVLVVLMCAGCGSGSEESAPEPSDGVDAADMFINLRIEDITDVGASLRFDTAIETTCEARFGTAANALDRSALDPSMDPANPYGIEHDVPLPSLTPSTTYFVRAFAEDRQGIEYLSEALTFTTLPATTPVGDEPVNVARISMGSTITEVSSNFGGASNSQTWGANNAIDGNLNTEWSSNSDGDDAYLVIDLGASRSVEELRFRSRKMTDGTSIIQSLTITVDGGDVLGPYQTPSPDTLYSIPFEPALVGRRFRVDAVETTGGNTGAKEIQLFAPMQ